MPRRLRRPAPGALRAPLDVALGAPARVAALRVLTALPAPLSQRELARRAGTQVRSAQQALEALAALGLVTRTVGGRDTLVRLNVTHHLAPALRALFDAEADGFRRLRADLVAAVPARWRRRIASLAAFGSAARAQDVPGSDLDLLLIVADGADRDEAEAAVKDAAAGLEPSFGARVRVLAYTRREARTRYRRRRPPFDTLTVDAVPLLGPPLADLLA
jgi:predicted nucleotidyltransferase